MHVVGVFRRGKKAYGELRERDKLPLSLRGGVLAEWIMAQVKRRRDKHIPRVELRVSHSNDAISQESAKNFAAGFVNRIGLRGGFDVDHWLERSDSASEWSGLRLQDEANKTVVHVRIGGPKDVSAVAEKLGLRSEMLRKPDTAALFIRTGEKGKSRHVMTSSRFHGQSIEKILVGRG